MRFVGTPVLALAFTTLTVVAAGCTNELDVRTEFDVEHDEAFVAEGEDLRASLTRDADGRWVTGVVDIHSSFDRIGIRYDTATPLTVEGRVGVDAQGLGAWLPVNVTFEEGLAKNAHFDVVDADGLPFEGGVVQLRLDDPRSLSFLAIAPIRIVVSDGDNDDVIAPPSDDRALQALAADGIAVTRSGWGARSRNCSNRHTPTRLTIHHTATPNNDSLSMPARMRQIQAFHINDRNYCDIGYHFLIGQDGRVYQGRPENHVGAHALGANTNNVGISFIGTYASRAPSGDMMAAAARIMRAMADTYGITLNRTQVKGHRQVGSTDTDCPGAALYGQLQSLVDLARASSSLQPPPSGSRPSGGTASCASATLGRTVDDGTLVQVDYAGCGVDSCGWYSCDDGSWVCGTVGNASADTERFAHGNCAVADEPFRPEVPDDEVPEPTPSGDEDVIVVESLPATLTGDSRTLRRDNWNTYSCDGNREGGSEAIYQVTLDEAGTLSARVDDVSGDAVDLDVYLLSALDPSTCLARDNVGIEERLTAGTYFVVVDTWTNGSGVDQAGPFTLRLDVDAGTVTDPNDGGDNGAACPTGVTCLTSANQRLTGTTVGGSDRFDRFNCSSANVSGPERIYRVAVNEAGFLSARLSGGGSTVDVDAHLLSDLSADACLHRGDSVAGAYVSAGVYYVVVDTFVPSSNADKSGGFTLDLHHTGVSTLAGHGMTSTVAQRALTAYDKAWKAGTTDKLVYTIIDFDQRSSNRRLWSVDLATGALLHHLHVSHGIGSNSSSDAARAVRWSNVSGSNQSSVGLAKGAEVYSGSHGRSLRLDGLEPGFNSNMRSRAIVIHAADYARPSFASQNGYLGRSHGCPAVDPARSNALIDTVKSGGLLFSHATQSTWLDQSRYLR